MWQIFLRYLCIWLIIFLGLCVVSVVIHWSELAAVCSDTFSSYVSLCGVCGIMLLAIAYLILGIFMGD